jgi:hypothetical protein
MAKTPRRGGVTQVITRVITRSTAASSAVLLPPAAAAPAEAGPTAAELEAADALLRMRYDPAAHQQRLAQQDAEQLELCTRLLAEATERVQQLRASMDATARATDATEAIKAYSLQLHIMNLESARQTETALRTSMLYIEHLITARRAFQ